MKETKMFYANSESPQMIDSFKKAQNTFKYFWRELYWERHRIVPALGIASVKVVFYQKQLLKSPLVEYMWINDIEFDGIHIKGSLINAPEILTNIKEGDTVEISLSRITDWLFTIDDKVYGGFTIQAMRSGMNKKEKEEHDSAWGLDFGASDKIFLVYEQEKHPENLIEHPMSINMREKVKEYFDKNPNELMAKDEFGYIQLHKETIAGNKALVELLIEKGVDINVKTNTGYTALDFAQKLEWEHIIPILKK
jgi:uncharacterized protein YegJ (DUF2314 family)